MNLLKYLKNTKFQLILGLVFVLLIILSFKFSTPQYLPEVVSTYPTSGAKNVLDNSIILITFKENIGSKVKDNITISISPETPGIPSWQDDHVLLITPHVPLAPDTQYQVIIKAYSQEIYSFTFDTNVYSTRELNEQVKQQMVDDLNFAKTEAELYQNMPWLRQIPLETPNFRVVYDFDKAAFRIRILDPNLLPDQRSAITNQALDAIAGLGLERQDIKYNVVE